MEFLTDFFVTANTFIVGLFFVFGIVCIIKGGDWFVDSAGWIAEVLGVPKFIIGATIVSIATTLPEMIVSVAAAMKGNVEMAAGNAIGSVTANTAMIMGLLIICIPSTVKRKEFAPKAIIMICASAALFSGCYFTEINEATFSGETGLFHRLSNWGIIALIIIFIAFFAENFVSLKNNENQIEASPDNIGLQPEDGIFPTKETVTKTDWLHNILLFALGAVGIVIGAQILVNSGTELAERIGIPQRAISIVAIAVGTSLPELVTAITAIRKKEGSLSVGNILGANIIDLTLILPLCSLVSTVKGNGALAVSYSSVHVDMVICFAAIAVTLIPTIITNKFHRWQGALALAGYIAYIAATFAG